MSLSHKVSARVTSCIALHMHKVPIIFRHSEPRGSTLDSFHFLSFDLVDLCAYKVLVFFFRNT